MDKAWWTAALKVGVPSALLGFLIFWLTGDFNMRLRGIEAQHQTMITHQERTEDLTGRTYMSIERAARILSIMCANDAKNAEARRLCLEAQ